MKIPRILLLAIPALLLFATDSSAQTQAVDPSTYNPAWTPGQRNIPFAFRSDTGELLVTARTPLRASITTATSAVIISASTLSDGTSFVTFPSQACVALDIVNNSSADIEYRRGGAGQTMTIPAGGSRLIIAITNANQIGIRRVDTAATVTLIKAEAINL